MESNFDFESIADQIYDQEQMELFTGVMYVLASQTYELDWYSEVPSNGTYDDISWLVIWRTLEMAEIVHKPYAPGPYDEVSGYNFGQIQSVGLKYSMNHILRDIQDIEFVTAEWLTYYQCCYGGLGDSRVDDYALMLNYAMNATQDDLLQGVEYWTNPNVTFQNYEFYTYTTMVPAMIKMFVLNMTDMEEFWTMGYESTNFYDYTIYEDQYNEPEFFAEFDEDEDNYESVFTAAYMGELLEESYMMDIYLFAEQEI